MEQLECCQDDEHVQKPPHERLGDEEPDQESGVRVASECLEPGECLAKNPRTGHAPARAFGTDPENQERRAGEKRSTEEERRGGAPDRKRKSAECGPDQGTEALDRA